MTKFFNIAILRCGNVSSLLVKANCKEDIAHNYLILNNYEVDNVDYNVKDTEINALKLAICKIRHEDSVEVTDVTDVTEVTEVLRLLKELDEELKFSINSVGELLRQLDNDIIMKLFKYYFTGGQGHQLETPEKKWITINIQQINPKKLITYPSRFSNMKPV